jgi:hypothetical protein
MELLESILTNLTTIDESLANNDVNSAVKKLHETIKWIRENMQESKEC